MMEYSHEETLTILRQGELSVEGEFVWGSNYTFYAKVEHEGGVLSGVYKPTQGERPLWDFPPATLARREVAAYLVSEALGWKLVPPTVYRSNGPQGPGSLQLYIDHDPEYHYFNFREEDQQRLRPTALFDLLINNADRKGSHILVDAEKHIWLIDHGVCFHVDDKLRTVIWDFAGEAIPGDLCSDLVAFHEKLVSKSNESTGLVKSFQPLLHQEEIDALAQRAERLFTSQVFPSPDPHRRPYPWPQV